MAGRGPAWDRLALNDRAGTIDDQAEALPRWPRLYPDDVDTHRVAIRGWSSAATSPCSACCAVRTCSPRPSPGAPTTDERLYDTCYSERYLGHPDTNADVYEANNVIPLAPQLRKPLMIIHGLADDNVYVAHSLRLSSALLAAGKPHEFLPLSGDPHGQRRGRRREPAPAAGGLPAPCPGPAPARAGRVTVRRSRLTRRRDRWPAQAERRVRVSPAGLNASVTLRTGRWPGDDGRPGPVRRRVRAVRSTRAADRGPVPGRHRRRGRPGRAGVPAPRPDSLVATSWSAAASWATTSFGAAAA